MPGVRRAEDLVVWKLCDRVRRRAREIVGRPIWRHHLHLRDQLDRAAEAGCPNIKEGFDRFYPRDNARFVRIAKATMGETIEHVDAALAKGLVTAEEAAELTRLCNRARAAAINFIRYLETAKVPGIDTPPGQRHPPPEGRQRAKEGPDVWTDTRVDDPQWDRGR